MTNFLTDAKSLEDLFSRMVSPDREVCESYKSLKQESSFLERIFVVYKPTGLTKEGAHKAPAILTQIKILEFKADARTGSAAVVQDLITHEIMTVDYIPKRLFHYDIFCSVAPRQQLRWDLSLIGSLLRRSMLFTLLFKVRSQSDFYSAGVTAIETPANFRALYPAFDLTLITNN